MRPARLKRQRGVYVLLAEAVKHQRVAGLADQQEGDLAAGQHIPGQRPGDRRAHFALRIREHLREVIVHRRHRRVVLHEAVYVLLKLRNSRGKVVKAGAEGRNDRARKARGQPAHAVHQRIPGAEKAVVATGHRVLDLHGVKFWNSAACEDQFAGKRVSPTAQCEQVAHAPVGCGRRLPHLDRNTVKVDRVSPPDASRYGQRARGRLDVGAVVHRMKPARRVLPVMRRVLKQRALGLGRRDLCALR